MLVKVFEGILEALMCIPKLSLLDSDGRNITLPICYQSCSGTARKVPQEHGALVRIIFVFPPDKTAVNTEGNKHRKATVEEVVDSGLVLEVVRDA